MVYYPIDIEKAVRKECKRRRYSERTIETYIFWIRKFFEFCKKELRHISKKDVRLFLEHLSEKEKAGSTLNVCHMALRFLFEDVLDKRIWINIKYSKERERIPIVLTKEEVKGLIDCVENHKHKIMISLLYSAGLRVSELINLKVRDLNLKKSYGFVRNGKGGKDRLFIISEKIKIVLIQICSSKKPEEYVFISNRNRKYSIRTIQAIIKKAAKKARIDKKVSCHTLRHSFATHLIEQGNSINEVQALLGHKSPETTMTYLHSSAGKMLNIKSPLDSL